MLPCLPPVLARSVNSDGLTPSHASWPAALAPPYCACQLAGRPLPGEQASRPDAPGGGKSGLQGSTVAA